nr:methyltransferase domain-containing protein [Aquabacterium sp.]
PPPAGLCRARQALRWPPGPTWPVDGPLMATQRLRQRRLSWLRRDYLPYRALWPALGAAVQAPLAGRSGAGLVVDVGCGERPYADLFGAAWCIGLDRSQDCARPDILTEATHLPLAGGCADIVLCTQVAGHERQPAALLAACARLLHPGGQPVQRAPFWWSLHEQPHDDLRFTRHCLAAQLANANLQVLAAVPDSGAMTAAVVAVIEALLRRARPLVPLLNLLAPLPQAVSPDRQSTLNWVVRDIPSGPAPWWLTATSSTGWPPGRWRLRRSMPTRTASPRWWPTSAPRRAAWCARAGG